jgi:hypothetical protein
VFNFLYHNSFLSSPWQQFYCGLQLGTSDVLQEDRARRTSPLLSCCSISLHDQEKQTSVSLFLLGHAFQSNLRKIKNKQRLVFCLRCEINKAVRESSNLLGEQWSLRKAVVSPESSGLSGEQWSPGRAVVSPESSGLSGEQWSPGIAVVSRESSGLSGEQWSPKRPVIKNCPYLFVPVGSVLSSSSPCCRSRSPYKSLHDL